MWKAEGLANIVKVPAVVLGKGRGCIDGCQSDMVGKSCACTLAHWPLLSNPLRLSTFSAPACLVRCTYCGIRLIWSFCHTKFAFLGCKCILFSAISHHFFTVPTNPMRFPIPQMSSTTSEFFFVYRSSTTSPQQNIPFFLNTRLTQYTCRRHIQHWYCVSPITTVPERPSKCSLTTAGH